MTQWAVFAGVTALVLVLLLALAYASQRATSGERDAAVTGPRADSFDTKAYGQSTRSPGVERRGSPTPDAEPNGVAPASTGALLVNVALSQGVLLVLLVATAWYARVPLWALGVGGRTGIQWGVLVGVGVGVSLYLLNELGSRGTDAAGIETAERLRTSLAPGSATGWVVLLGVVLPVIAVFEEFLFRAALVGALSAGFAVSPWLVALVSSAAFALGHGAQGTVGMVATGGLGFVLAAAFVATESLLVVVVAHYLVNALEFVVHEGIGTGRSG